MPLDEYRRKRDFDKTPEPSGDERHSQREPSSTTGYFCVQKHLASRLHYDLRLEHDGVLLSWAVPKGPSLDPSDKRMAVATEDHPLAYGDFEGVIPEGYGAGVVMLWDHGRWTPEVHDVDAALRKGDLKFSLDGYKLKGSWVLVRIRDKPGTTAKQRGRSWLLIKHRDFWSGPVDITEFAPLSVKSEGDFDDILADDMPRTWITGRPGGAVASRQLLATVESAARKILDRDAATPGAGGGGRQTATRKKTVAPSTKKRTARKGPSRVRAVKKR